MRILGILLCAGTANRMGFDKLTTPLCGKTAVERSVESLLAGGCTELMLTANELTSTYLETLDLPVRHHIIAGGETRQQSVYAALRAADGDAEDLAVIHDAARCMVTPEIVARCIASARQTGSGIAATQAVDTILQNTADGIRVIPRDEVLLMQTPQCFRFGNIWAAYQNADFQATDDCTLYTAAGYMPQFVLCSPDNFKLTTPMDWTRAERILTRYGTGYDTHILVENRPLLIGGVRIPFKKGLLGHSDADVLLHAIMDALLGAAALGDIGKHFPDTDLAYQGADSRKLLERCGALLRERGYTPVSIDATVIAQQPKLAPYIQEMRKNIAFSLNMDISEISIKATTTEHMNDEGKGLCISTQAIASIR
ncbi:MAG: 2-C-methyl-D-erythritol 2,4-cyclodiphosphate synthase [Clostridia bacterium]